MTISQGILHLLEQNESDPAFHRDSIIGHLSQLLAAPAPANSCLLPGAVGDVIREIAGELGLTCAPIGASGNLGIAIGDPAAHPDLVITAHMDRPCFRVLSLPEATLYPLCAVRVPSNGYRCDAMALHFRDGRVQITARGELLFSEAADGYRITFAAKSGELAWGDTVMMFAAPTVRDGQVTGTGLDNATGVLLGLLAARALKAVEIELVMAGQKVVFVFTDQEEGPPIGLFGRGAARLAHALPPPRLGFINIDAHNVDQATGHTPGIGASHAFVSGHGRGSVVPLDFQALAETLAGAVNAIRTGTVRLNYSYVSRSDDMLLSAWSRCLGLIGVTLEQAHTTEETIALDDLVAAARWIPAFVTQALDS